MSVLKPCPRFERCGAPVCPFDSAYRSTEMLRNEAVCHYLREHAKPAGPQRVTDTLGERLSNQIQEAYDWCMENMYPMRKALQRASKTRSKTDQAKYLKGSN